MEAAVHACDRDGIWERRLCRMADGSMRHTRTVVKQGACLSVRG